jgi:hypothetical protein
MVTVCAEYATLIHHGNAGAIVGGVIVSGGGANAWACGAAPTAWAALTGPTVVGSVGPIVDWGVCVIVSGVATIDWGVCVIGVCVIGVCVIGVRVTSESVSGVCVTV